MPPTFAMQALNSQRDFLNTTRKARRMYVGKVRGKLSFKSQSEKCQTSEMDNTLPTKPNCGPAFDAQTSCSDNNTSNEAYGHEKNDKPCTQDGDDQEHSLNYYWGTDGFNAAQRDIPTEESKLKSHAVMQKTFLGAIRRARRLAKSERRASQRLRMGIGKGIDKTCGMVCGLSGNFERNVLLESSMNIARLGISNLDPDYMHTLNPVATPPLIVSDKESARLAKGDDLLAVLSGSPNSGGTTTAPSPIPCVGDAHPRLSAPTSATSQSSSPDQAGATQHPLPLGPLPNSAFHVPLPRRRRPPPASFSPLPPISCHGRAAQLLGSASRIGPTGSTPSSGHGPAHESTTPLPLTPPPPPSPYVTAPAPAGLGWGAVLMASDSPPAFAPWPPRLPPLRCCDPFDGRLADYSGGWRPSARPPPPPAQSGGGGGWAPCGAAAVLQHVIDTAAAEGRLQPGEAAAARGALTALVEGRCSPSVTGPMLPSRYQTAGPGSRPQGP
jgi:hypothetical protein